MAAVALILALVLTAIGVPRILRLVEDARSTREVGIGVERLGTSSVTYRIGVFRQGGGQAVAQGRFTHVYVERAAQKPVAIPEGLRAALAGIGVG